MQKSNYRSLDISGQRFGRLMVIRRHGYADNGNALFECVCDCGTEVVKRGSHIRLGSVQSCGCFHDTHGIGKSYGLTHGQSRSPTYGSWAAMKDRCYREGHMAFNHYGGRGILVCERWLKFENFLEDMGVRPTGTTLDRYPNKNGSYEPGNCRWATPKQQQRNTARNVILDHGGESKCIAEWAEYLGLKHSTLKERIRRGWSLERALQPL